jgi:glycerol-3-phosphate dehydrogenase
MPGRLAESHNRTPGLTRDSYDVAIIGAGVLGCAIARSFAIRGWSTLVVEKAKDILEGASKGNSAILHNGYDEPPDSVERKMVRSGCALYRRIHHRMNLPLVETGALVVAWSPEQAAKLDGIACLARRNGITDVALLGAEELAEREPHLSKAAKGALAVPGEAIIDPWSAPLAYLRQALLHGGALVTEAAVHAIVRRPEGWRVVTAAGEFAARLVVNAAGLFADQIESLRGGRPSFSIRPRKGQFLVFDKPAHDLITAIILKVPTERTKGVLLTRTVFGNLLLGPTAEDQQSRTHAPCEEAMLRQMLDEGTSMLPALADETVSATFAGLRPATEHRDYVLAVDDKDQWITVAGIRSTGLSAALGLGEWAAENGSRLLGEARAAPPDDDLDWPPMPNLSASSPRPYERPDRSPIACHCEWVTESEINAALYAPIPPGTLGGLKRRTRAMMGRCQGFGCMAAVQGLAPELFRDARA